MGNLDPLKRPVERQRGGIHVGRSKTRSEVEIVNFKELDRTIETWKQSFIAAAQRVLVAEELALRSPDEPSLRLDLEAAWEDYRDVCRDVLELVPINTIFAGVPRLILSEVILAAEDTKSAEEIEEPRDQTHSGN